MTSLALVTVSNVVRDVVSTPLRIGRSIGGFIAIPFSWKYLGRCGGWGYWQNTRTLGRKVRWLHRPEADTVDDAGEFIPMHRSWLAGAEWNPDKYTLVQD